MPNLPVCRRQHLQLSPLVKIATWNVNGIRARHAQLEEWVARERPDVICLQEIKATPDQIPAALWGLDGYWCYWHGGKGYSGVALHVSQTLCPERPTFAHPEFDFENRIVTVTLAGMTVASIYVPNGGKDFPAKMRFLGALDSYAASLEAAGTSVVLCGDLNIARTERDVHPKERKPRAIGQLPEERAQLLSRAKVTMRRIYRVGVNLIVPGGELVVSRAPDGKQEHEDVYVAIRDSFDAAERLLEDHVRRKRG